MNSTDGEFKNSRLLFLLHPSPRYIDDIFMTTNLPLNEISQLLDRANSRDENIKITRSIGSTIEFLDVSVSNDQGQLRTSVYHKPAAEPYILPFSSDHPRHVHRNTVRGALFRAVRLCSHVDDFDQEQLNIELMLLLNGYPPRFVAHHFKQFFQQHDALSLLQELDQDVYQRLHHHLIHQPSRRERERRRDVKSDADSSTPHHTEEERKDGYRREIRVHFTFESGPMLNFKRELRHLWKQHYNYPGSPMTNVTLKIGTRTNRSLQQLLVKNKPPKSVLINVDRPSIQ